MSPREPKELRTIRSIARSIRDNWLACYIDKFPQPAFLRRALPYLEAMYDLDTPADRSGLEGGDMIVAHFLDLTNTWRGDFARSVKAELNEHLKRYNQAKEG